MWSPVSKRWCVQHGRAGTLVIVVRAAGSTNTYPRHLNHVIKLKPSEHSKTESLMLSFYFHLFLHVGQCGWEKASPFNYKKEGCVGWGWDGGGTIASHKHCHSTVLVDNRMRTQASRFVLSVADQTNCRNASLD